MAAQSAVNPLADELESLRRERDELAARSKTGAGKATVDAGDMPELMRLRAQVARLTRTLAETKSAVKSGGAAPAAANGPGGAPGVDASNAAGLLDTVITARITQFRERLEQNPAQRIPELALATEEDWKDVAKNATWENPRTPRRRSRRCAPDRKPGSPALSARRYAGLPPTTTGTCRTIFRWLPPISIRPSIPRSWDATEWSRPACSRTFPPGSTSFVRPHRLTRGTTSSFPSGCPDICRGVFNPPGESARLQPRALTGVPFTRADASDGTRRSRDRTGRESTGAAPGKRPGLEGPGRCRNTAGPSGNRRCSRSRGSPPAPGCR